MASVYRSTFVDPYPNGFENRPKQTTPIDAEALNPIRTSLKAIDIWLNGVNKDRIGEVRKVICTQDEWNDLPDTKYSDGVIYFITDGGVGTNYSNYEEEVF